MKNAIGSLLAVMMLLTMSEPVFAHGVGGGPGGRYPDYHLALVMAGTAAFGIIAFTVKRIGFRLPFGMLVGSFLVLMFSLSEQAKLQEGLGDLSLLDYYGFLQLLPTISFTGIIGGAIFMMYHYWAVRPYLKNKGAK